MTPPPGHRWPIRIYYEDTDAGRIVYHANYLRFMERARTEWLRGLGFEQDALARAESVFFVVKKISIDYRQPARFNDEIEVASSLLKCGRASMVFGQDIVRGDTLLCRAEIKVGCVDTASLRPCKIPPNVYREMVNAAG